MANRVESPLFTDLGHGITRIDTGYVRYGGAACYLVERDGELAFVETGVSATVARIEALLRERDLRPEAVRYVIPTHVHLDHAGAAGQLMARFPAARLIAHPRGARHLINPDKLIAGARAVYGDERFDALYGEIIPVPESRVTIAEDGDSLSFGGGSLLFRDAPGHANHHFVIWDEQSLGWFTGDTFGLCYPQMVSERGRMIMPSTTPVQFDPEKLRASIAMMMEARPRRMYLTHFGALENATEMARQLLEKIDRYCEIAQGFRAAPSAETEIARALYDLEFNNLSRIRPDLSTVAVDAILALDIDLNAQGLAHWVKQTSRE